MIKKLIMKLFTREIMSYLIAGVLTTLVNWLIYALSIKLSGGSEGAGIIKIFKWEINQVIFISNAAAWTVAVIFAYIANRYFVFTERAHGTGKVFVEFWKFIGARVATGIIEIAGPTFLFSIGLNIDFFGIDGGIAKIIVSVIVIILNYVFSKLFVFKSKMDNVKNVNDSEK